MNGDGAPGTSTSGVGVGMGASRGREREGAGEGIVDIKKGPVRLLRAESRTPEPAENDGARLRLRWAGSDAEGTEMERGVGARPRERTGGGAMFSIWGLERSLSGSASSANGSKRHTGEGVPSVGSRSLGLLLVAYDVDATESWSSSPETLLVQVERSGVHAGVDTR